MEAGQRDLDVVLYGATGSVGRLTASTTWREAEPDSGSHWPAVRPERLTRCGRRCPRLRTAGR